jgi:hypothetical protein
VFRTLVQVNIAEVHLLPRGCRAEDLSVVASALVDVAR